ncbi:unnamed protein product [Menidia menidia]|uniref:(Atlantic silverside) hypothetical protein n=1 Tax=Menidia menidia TaxID=238744 RepID=A0A8S4AJG6_9TELE|nr:unnamed protein product [Menidia menidia]
MNLFCFTLEGSTESIYEPAYKQTLVEAKHQHSPTLLRHKSEWGGSDPSIHYNNTKLKRDCRRSCVLTSALEDETSASCQSSQRNETVKELVSEKTLAETPAELGVSEPDSADSAHPAGRLKKLQNLVQAKKGHHGKCEKFNSPPDKYDCLAEVARNNNTVLTCISLGRRTEKRACKKAAPPQPLQPQPSRDVQKDAQEEGEAWGPRMGHHQWRPFECQQPWTPFYHTCQQARHELWTCGGSLSLPRTSEWDRFESLIQEMDSKQSDMCLPQMIRSITDLHFSQSTKRPDQNSEPIKPKVLRREMETSSQSDRKHIEASAEKTLTAVSDRGVQGDGGGLDRAAGCGRALTKRQRQSRNSLESLYSLKSGQSSSSGVTSGSDCSSNRDSLRLDDELLLTKQLFGKARVHTAFVPSPYDSESLKLKVGDVIDIIAKPPMGIWKGMLDGKIGNFKFIYVDVLTEQISEFHLQRERHKSTVKEVLKHLGLEEYSTSLQLSGYETVDDLMRLREHDLVELNVSNPEHRQCLLFAIDSLQRLHSDRELEHEASLEPKSTSEDSKADMRDSGCLMTSDSPDGGEGDADLPYPLEHLVPADT